MTKGCGRRGFLTVAATIGAGCVGRTSAIERQVPSVTGAVYWPRHAYTHFQTWDTYRPAEIDRDFGYAKRLNLDALRIIVGYEFWRDAPARFKRAFDHLLQSATRHGLSVLPVLFESVGQKPDQAALRDTDIRTAHAVQSPGPTVIRNPAAWDGPRRFTRWFTKTFGDRIVALEVMNEPCGWPQRVEFCRDMLRSARRTAPHVPLTLGCKDVHLNTQFTNPPLDIFQYHHNDPATPADLTASMAQARAVGDRHGKPVWLTEWQRTTQEPPLLKFPHYASLASTVRSSQVDGDFFWQLMLKPAYVQISRDIGRVEGVFHPDGTVYSGEDAKAIAGGDPPPERADLPATWIHPDAR